MADGAADEFCHGLLGQQFYVEATCIREETATGKTGLPTMPGGSGPFAYPVKAIQQKCRDKARQCAELNAACLLAVATLHFQASCVAFTRDLAERMLTGKQTLSYYGMREPSSEALQQTADQRTAAFSKQREGTPGEFKHARKTISGVLLCPFGRTREQTEVLGVLHPDAVRPFDRALLPSIPFCRLMKSGPDREQQVRIEWSEPGQPG